MQLSSNANVIPHNPIVCPRLELLIAIPYPHRRDIMAID